METTIEELYGITKNEVDLKRVITKSGRHLEVFESPGALMVSIEAPEFTCLCPRTGHPDFATICIDYLPDGRCVELKSLKYYLNSFRDQGHFHEEVTHLIEQDLRGVLMPRKLAVTGKFNVRGGMYPTIFAGDYPVGTEKEE